MTETTEAGRKLRVKERKTYTDVDIDDDDIEGKRNYALDEKLRTHKYSKKYVKELKGEDFNLKYLQENGLESPIVFYEKTGLGLRVPSENFKVADVKQCVGSRRMLDVMDVNTQKGMEMSMREWVQYYENPERQRLLNVISLEFSHTKLENYVESPNIVRQIDWVDTVWPKHLKECQTESTNIIERMKYPKVQKYCLMSVQGCYTDFHIDFGGTSVWYHILHGEKVFWLIPPTSKNIDLYTNWILSGKQGDIFLADHVEGCQRIELRQGYTFIIPSGWIHAVYTPKDSLVFGGNFLHSYNIINQLRVTEVEDKTHVPQKFRYPFYAEIAWYVLARYINCVTGKQCLELPVEDKENSDDKRESSPFIQDDCSQDGDQTYSNSPATPKLSKSVTIELTRIDQSSPKRKSTSDDENVTPHRLRSPRKSSSDSCSSADTEIYDKTDEILGPVINNEKSVDSKLSIIKKNKSDEIGAKKVDSPSVRKLKKENKVHHLTKWELKGLSRLIDWIEELPPTKKGVPKDMIDSEVVLKDAKQLLEDHANDDQLLACNGEPILVWPPSRKLPKPKVYKTGHVKVPKSQQGKQASGNRRRRTRCKKCEPCTRTDCGECNFCKDMKKFGGPGRMKQSCKSRQCLAPVIPSAATCMICGKDDRIKSADNPEEMITTLMECCICWEINHPSCHKVKHENLENEGVINEDLPNSWECPKCCQDGKQGMAKSKLLKMKKEVGVYSPRPGSMYSPRPGSPASSYDSTLDVKSESEAEGKRVVMKQEKDFMELETDEESLTETETGFEAHEPSPTIPVKPVYKFKTTLSSSVEKPKLKRPLKPKLSLSPKKLLKKGLKKKIMRPLSVGNSYKKRASWSSSPEKSPTPDKKPETVFTRSGRKVKRSPQLSDENIESELPRKRPKREGLATRPDGTDGMEVKVMKGQGLHSPLKYKGKDPENVNSDLEFEDISVEHTRIKKYSGDKQKVAKKRTPNTQGVKRKIGSFKKAQKSDGTHSENKSIETQPSEPTKKKVINVPEIVERKFVVRPPAPPPPPDSVEMEYGGHHPLKRAQWTKVFYFLPFADLARCLSVCKAFYRWGMNHELWPEIDLSRKRICQPHLIGMVKRQPAGLKLNTVIMTQMQLSWLLARIPQLKSLSMSSCSWATVSALCFSSCPLLTSLNLNWILGLNKQCFSDLITPPTDLRPGMQDISRLHRLVSLQIAGTEIDDDSLQLIPQYLTKLENLDISYCARITNEGIRKLFEGNNGVLTKTMKVIDLSGSRILTSVSLDSLTKCSQLSVVKIHKCPSITALSVHNFPKKSVKFRK